MQTAKVPERAMQKCVRSGSSSDSFTYPRHLYEVRTLHRKFNPDWRRDAAFPLWKISSSSCAIKVLVANTLLFFLIPFAMISVIWRILHTRFRISFELFSHLLCLLDVSFATSKKVWHPSQFYLPNNSQVAGRHCLRHLHEYWLFNARHSLNIQACMPVPLTQVEELLSFETFKKH